MRLVSYLRHRADHPRPGVLDGDRVVDLSAAGTPAPASMLDLLRSGQAGLELARSALARGHEIEGAFPLSQVRLTAPLPRPNSIRDFMLVEEHVARTASAGAAGVVPSIPVHWKGNPDTVLGPMTRFRGRHIPTSSTTSSRSVR